MAGPRRSPRGKHLRYLFDVTTIAQWEGAPVGFARVERELARRARRYLGKDAGFCVYDRAQGAILQLDNSIAEDVVAGRLRIDFTNGIPVPQPENPIRRQIRTLLRSNATVYRLFQRAKGRAFTPQEILQIKAKEGEVKFKRLANLPHRPAALDGDTTIISAGLHWNYKDLRVFRYLKQLHQFCYCPIIYNLISIFAPHFVVPDHVDPLTIYFGELLWVADHAMCISQATRREWLEHAYNIGAKPVRSRVFPLGCDLSIQAKRPMATLPPLTGKQFAVYVSTIEARKNHRMLYEAWEECFRAKQLDPNRHRLVFIGRRGWGVGDLLREIETNPLTKETIVLLHEVSDEQLSVLYQACSFVLVPSLYEGFALPLAEALGYGKLCISSNMGALSEIGGDLVMRLDPKDTLLWSRTIGQLFSSPAEVKAWERRIRKRYRPTTWDDAARIFFTNVKSVKRDRSAGQSRMGEGADVIGPAGSPA
jgi:glycosyltransferase involved in cell wall biosynthesis